MENYHLRHPNKAIENIDEIYDVIASQRYLTLAMSRNDEPYLVTVNFAFDKETECFYFHCAKKGRKLEYLRGNPNVWGQVLEDLGYVEGHCDHNYRTVMFRGTAEILEDLEETRHAMGLLIESQEADPSIMRKKHIETGTFDRAHMVRIRALSFTGKVNINKGD